MDEEGNQFVAYFLPNEDTLRKRKRDVEEELDYMPEELYEHTNAHKHTVSAKPHNCASLHITVQQNIVLYTTALSIGQVLIHFL